MYKYNKNYFENGVPFTSTRTALRVTTAPDLPFDSNTSRSYKFSRGTKNRGTLTSTETKWPIEKKNHQQKALGRSVRATLGSHHSLVSSRSQSPAGPVKRCTTTPRHKAPLNKNNVQAFFNLRSYLMGLDSPAALEKKKYYATQFKRQRPFDVAQENGERRKSVEEEVSEREGLRVPTRGVPSGGRR